MSLLGMNDQQILNICLFLSALWIGTIPLYIYGFIKWYQFRDHFLIRKRFPNITYCLATSAIIEHILSTVIFWLFYYHEDDAIIKFILTDIEAVAFTALSLILYRGFLLYLQWKKYQQVIQDKSKSKRSNSISTVANASNPWEHPLAQGFVMFIIFGTILIILKDWLYPQLSIIVWTIAMIIGFILIFVLYYFNVQEGIF